MRFSFQLSRRWRERLHHWWRTIAAYVTYPWFMLVGAVNWVIALVARAWSTRHFRYLIQGFPALFALGGVAVAGAFVATGQSQEYRANLAKEYLARASEEYRLAGRYTEEKDKSKQLEHLGVARVYIEKALSLEGGDRDDLKYQLALVLEQSGNLEHSRAIMYKLAPDTANGFAGAHLWRANHFVKNFALEPPVLAAIENHYSRAYEIGKSEPDNNVSNAAAYFLSNMLVNTGRLNEAIPLLEKIEDRIPIQRLTLGDAYSRVNRQVDADKMYKSAEKHFRNLAEKKLDDKESRMYLAQALMRQQKFEEAVEVLHKGTVVTKDPRFMFELSEAFRFWERKLASEPNSKLNDRLGLIQKGVQYYPANVQLLARLHEFSTMVGPEGEEASKQIDKLISDGVADAIIYFIKGSFEFRYGNIELARDYWEKAYQRDPTFNFILNNLAWLLAHDEKRPDVDRAMEMIEKVIAQQPNIPNFIGTRGQIRVKKKLYKEAIPDLLRGLQAQPYDLNLNRAAAEAYEATGDRKMAELHNKKIAEITEREAKQKLDAPAKPLIPSEIQTPKPGDPTKPPVGGAKPPAP